MSYTIVYSKKSKAFIKNHKLEGLRFMKAFDEIKEYLPKALDYDIVKLKGKKQIFRLRIGKYRAIFTYDIKNKIIKIIDMDSRGDIY